MPKVCIQNGLARIVVLVRIDQGVTGRVTKDMARPHVESNAGLCFMSGSVLTYGAEATGTAQAVITSLPKGCKVCGETHAVCPKCGSKEGVAHEQNYGLCLCVDCTEYACQAGEEMGREYMGCLADVNW